MKNIKRLFWILFWNIKYKKVPSTIKRGYHCRVCEAHEDACLYFDGCLCLPDEMLIKRFKKKAA